MNPSEDLQLRDIHLPPDPAWWPPAPGWWVLALLAVVISAWLAWRVRRRMREHRWQRLLARELDRVLADAGEDAALTIAGLSRLLRRVARMRDPQAAALQGRDWLAYLDRGLPVESGHGSFARHEQLLVDAQFRAPRDPALHDVDVDVHALASLVRTWLARAAAEIARA